MHSTVVLTLHCVHISHNKSFIRSFVFGVEICVLLF